MEGYDNMDNNTNNNISGIPNVSDIKFDDTPAESFDNLYGGGVSAQQPVGNINMNQGPTMVPNQGMTMNVNPAPAVAPNPSVVPSVNPAPAAAPNPSVAPSVNPAPAVAPNPGVAPSVNPAPAMAPNPGTMVQPDVEDLSNMDIDVEKMQSIEEQLSKTSQYNPADFQQEQITIPTDNQYEKNKSAVTFLIVLLIILGACIFLMPQVTKFIK